ncbi:RadC family protein [Sulfurovum sp. NBC37-1]|uniref:RadC family protein n=1 Tax=Sulfurovum sp. (strain NBC37-1) TaxID=387093 RepID=UPI000158797A|nr:DNA repair protein RadC [Sulfurovum sp. NBC37-1]BAF73233.1 DNA repair protein RadC [Sulfurovum sp. NBC37-1]
MKTIKELHRQDKPREKLAGKGAKALKNDELLSVLLGSGIQGKDVRKLSKEIISLFDDDFENLSLDKFCDIHGLGMAKASQILAAVELSKRYLIRSNKRICSAGDVYDELKQFSTKTQEHFLTITLDGASHIINTRTVFIGTLNQSLVHPREVFSDAISDRAAGIIIAHNHPSGTLESSRADIQITQRLKEVSKLVGIELLDHVILSKNGYYSFSDEGLL